MLLAIDVGNTNTVFAVYDDSTLIDHWRFQTIASRSADEYASFLKELFSVADLSWEVLSDVIISSVVPDVNFHITGFCEKYLKHEPIWISSESVNIEVDLENPSEIGADRIVNAVAVLEHYSAPAIVIDFGTATTFDVIDGKGRYSGGIIAPGIRLSVSALHQAAAKLPYIDIKSPEKTIGKNTVHAMQSGVYWGYVGLIEGLVNRITREMDDPSPPIVIATGGLAGLFADNTNVINHVDGALTIKGILKIYKDQKVVL